MAKKFLSAFSLAELLVAMLVLCIIIAAFAPIMTKRSKKTIINSFDFMAQTGTIMMWDSSNDPPSGWLLCDGRTFAQSDYPALYAALGNKNTTPNLQGYFIKGSEDTSVYGSVDATSANKIHYHGLWSSDEDGHNYTNQVPEGLSSPHGLGFYGDKQLKTNAGGAWTFYFVDGSGSNQLISQDKDVSGTTPTGVSEFRPKNIALKYIIKT